VLRSNIQHFLKKTKENKKKEKERKWTKKEKEKRRKEKKKKFSLRKFSTVYVFLKNLRLKNVYICTTMHRAWFFYKPTPT
jgi:microcompartment protein CcmL/EutN